MMTADNSAVRVYKTVGGVYHVEVGGRWLLDGLGRVARIGQRELQHVVLALEGESKLKEVRA